MIHLMAIIHEVDFYKRMKYFRKNYLELTIIIIFQRLIVIKNPLSKKKKKERKIAKNVSFLFQSFFGLL